MMIPKYIKKGNNIYEFVKRYPSFFMYEDKINGIRVCMDKHDLLGGGLKKQKYRRTKWEV